VVPKDIAPSKLNNEVHHTSEEVDDRVLADVVTALYRRVSISHDFDIPYIAGYSDDAKTIYIDPDIALEGTELQASAVLGNA